PHLNLAPVRARESLRLCDASGTPLRRLDGIEVHVGVTDREPAARLGASGVHHQRRPVTVERGRAFHMTEPIVRPLEGEWRCARPDPLDDAPPLVSLL